MKITTTDYNYLKDRITVFIDTIGIDAINAHKQAVKAENKFKDFDTRIAWDLFHGAKIRIGDGIGQHGEINLYSYLDDNHITTALKKIAEELNIIK